MRFGYVRVAHHVSCLVVSCIAIHRSKHLPDVPEQGAVDPHQVSGVDLVGLVQDAAHLRT